MIGLEDAPLFLGFGLFWRQTQNITNKNIKHIQHLQHLHISTLRLSPKKSAFENISQFKNPPLHRNRKLLPSVPTQNHHQPQPPQPPKRKKNHGRLPPPYRLRVNYNPRHIGGGEGTTPIIVAPQGVQVLRRCIPSGWRLDGRHPWGFRWEVFVWGGVLFLFKNGVILLMEEILHHLGCIKPCK